MTILVIDDEAGWRSIVERTFKPVKCKVLTAEDGKAGWDILEKEKIDLLLLDIVIPPPMTAEKVMRSIRSHPKIKDLPVILCTGHGERAQEVNECQALGSDFLFLKAKDSLHILRNKGVDLAKCRQNSHSNRIDPHALGSSKIKQRPYRVLIAEDDPDLSSWLRGLLERDGFETKVVHDGISVMEVCQKFQPDLMILDLHLEDSGPTGCETLHAIKSHPELASTVVLVFTGVVDKEVKRLCTDDFGAEGYLVKGETKAAKLLSTIKNHLRKIRVFNKQEIVAGSLRINLALSCAHLDDDLLPLTPMEFSLLGFVAAKSPKLVSWDILTSKVWELEVPEHQPSAPSYIEACLSRLRRKLGPAAKYLRTDRGEGLYLVGASKA